MGRPGSVVEIDRNSPPTLFHFGEGVRLERLPLGSRVIYPPEHERVTHFHSVRDPARIIARVLHTLVITKGMRRAPPVIASPEPEPIVADTSRKSRPDRDRVSVAPPSASPS